MLGTVSCAAVIAVRNEVHHIRRAVKSFVEQGVDVFLIDNASTDGTPDACREFIGRGLIGVSHLPWDGAFDLSRQLAEKQAVIRRLTHDWIIHADADELLQSPVAGESLIDGLSRIAADGYNVVNFEEFVFLPDATEAPDTAEPRDYVKERLNYYYFAPSENRLMRAWKRAADMSNLQFGGHRLAGADVRLAPESFVLRHYIVCSQDHAVRKYAGRRFSDTDLAKGWHGNRLDISPEKLVLPDQECLKRLSRWDSTEFDRSDPKQKHFWQWETAE